MNETNHPGDSQEATSVDQTNGHPTAAAPEQRAAGESAEAHAAETENAPRRPRFGDTDEEVARLVSILPPALREAVDALGDHGGLLEIVMDLGRPPEVRTFDGDVVFEHIEVSEDDLQHAVERIGHFGEDNRAGIARTLHRISAIRNREGEIIGLTLRVGRAIFGTVEIVRDIITEGRSILLLGAPGVGKTTMLRETARLLAEEKRVVIVDTSNEIAGDGDIPHPAIGRARRMQVKTPTAQHEVMIEAVENHNPEVIVIDEIGRELEALAARTIAERGVQLVGTAHGRTLENLLMNPTLSDLVGGIESVTLSDEEARRRGTQKSVLERRSPPTFDVVIEIEDWQHLIIHHDTAQAIDAHLRGRLLRPERRYTDEDGKAITERGDVEPGKPAETLGQVAGQQRRSGSDRRKEQAQRSSSRDARMPQPSATRPRSLKLLAYGVSQNRLRRSSKALSVPIILTDDLDEADAVITLKSYYRKRPAIISEAEERRTPVYVLRSNTYAQIEHALIDLFGMHTPQNRLAMALDETRNAIRDVERGTRRMVELSPQVSEIRKQQHELVRTANLRSLSNGNDPHRRVRVYRP